MNKRFINNVFSYINYIFFLFYCEVEVIYIFDFIFYHLFYYINFSESDIVLFFFKFFKIFKYCYYNLYYNFLNNFLYFDIYYKLVKFFFRINFFNFKVYNWKD